ncbi:MAG TPA: relaxase/mobilization nuclease domain-containing protein [Pseudorhizobium sp.]|jgi:hypothetical protein|nr:relaxase/mobilization nuclease domain-containing protein [Pseudorhizobium sp.]
MILKGSQRAGAGQLAAHLLNEKDNEHIEVAELRGFVASDLRGALAETFAISRATKCQQYMFSLSLSPPSQAVVSEEDFRKAIDVAEKRLGLEGQARAIVIHEKEGRRHAHAVWSRIDGQEIKAINLPHFKRKLTDLSKELYLDHGWQLPNGLAHAGGKSPLNFTLAEWQQARRLKIDPREIKQVFQEAWARSDNAKSFGNALAERGYFLARGDRRGFVAVDVNGNVFDAARWVGIKTKEARTKLGGTQPLMRLDVVQREVAQRMSSHLRGFLDEAAAKQDRDMQPLAEARRAMVQAQRDERALLKAKQEERFKVEAAARAARLRKGVGGLWDTLTGKAATIRERNEAETYAGLKRDAQQRHAVIDAQHGERSTLQSQIETLRRRHALERRLIAREASDYLRRAQEPPSPSPSHEHEQDLHRTRTRRRDGPSFDR